MKHFYIFMISFMAIQYAVGQTSLNPGEVRVVGFYGDANQGGEDCGDAFAFVSWVALEPGTEIRFSEEDFNEWSGTDNEGDLTWTNDTGASIPALTRINILTSEQGAGCGDGSPAATIGSAVYEQFGTNNVWQLNGSNEEIIIYQGPSPRNSSTFISLFLSDRDVTDGSDGNDANAPSALFQTAFASTFNNLEINGVDGDDLDVAIYIGPTAFTDFNDFTAQISDLENNWAIQNNGGGNDDGVDGTFPDFPTDLADFAGNLLSVTDVAISLFSINPNPAADNVVIESNQTINTVIIYNTVGKMVYKNMTFEKENNQIDVSQLQTGIYFMRASIGDAVQTLKLVKK